MFIIKKNGEDTLIFEIDIHISNKLAEKKLKKIT